MKSFLSFRGSRAGFFSDLCTGDSCSLRIPFDRPFDFTLRLFAQEAASLSTKDLMSVPDTGECHVKKDIHIPRDSSVSEL
jgi:hypothetical protein